jgi:phosphoribosylanthranilate isomerase
MALEYFITQIYEIQTPCEAEKMVDMGVDHVGSVLVSESEWRIPEIRETVSRVRSADAKSSLIPLFNTLDTVCRAMDYYRPHGVHFCENLTGPRGISEDCPRLMEIQAAVKERFPEIWIMRSIPIARPGKSGLVPTLELGRRFEPVSDFFLTDTLIFGETGEDVSDDQPVKGFVGITGKTCDWDMAGSLIRQSSIPVILAGGLGPDNVFNAIVKTRPAGVDSCTGTNALDPSGRPVRFKKDVNKVKIFIEAARRAALQINFKGENADVRKQ